MDDIANGIKHPTVIDFKIGKSFIMQLFHGLSRKYNMII